MSNNDYLCNCDVTVCIERIGEITGKVDGVGEITGAVGKPSCDGVTPTQGEFTRNGTYHAPSGYAYDPVVVDVDAFEPAGTIELTENGTYDVTEYAEAEVNVKQWDTELKAILDGSATELSGLPSGLSKIKPYAFYQPTKKLPAEYEELDSIYFNGNSIIETDVVNELNPKCYITAKLDGSRSASQVLYGYDRGGNGGSYFGAMPNQTVWSLGVGFNFTSALVKTDIIIQQNVIATNNFSITATVNGTTKTRTNSSTNGNFKVMIGGCVSSLGNVTYPIKGTVYGRIVFKASGEITQIYIPVKRISDNAVGYYEIIEGKFILPVGDALIGGTVIPIDETISVISADLDVTEIGAYAFCNNDLSNLTLRANQVVTLGEHALDGTPIADGTGTVYVPSSLVSAYEADSSWSQYNIQAIA